MNHTLLETKELSVVVGNNEAGKDDFACHCAGYNGIWSLAGKHSRENCFVPAYAGLNLEHFMDDLLFKTDEDSDHYEPRHIPMHLEMISATAVKLTHGPSPLNAVESETIFEVQEPNVINMRFRAKLHKLPRAGQRFGFFWASYINAPECPALQFKNQDGIWCCLSPDDHGRCGGNTVCHSSVTTPAFGNSQYQYRPGSLAHSFSSRRFSAPMMFGRPGDGSMLFLQMFVKPARSGFVCIRVALA